jgi:hypothetical protein
MRSETAGGKPAARRFLLALAIVTTLPYWFGPFYRFPAAEPFRGASFYNPYAGASGSWQRANLHAHGRPWGGLTNGRQSGAEIVKKYRAMGYSVAGVSDYQSIAAHHGVDSIPLYEHGFSLVKRHQLAIGARDVDWFDFPFWQTLSNQQYVIDRVAARTELVALAHPPSRRAYTTDNLRRLTRYHLLEVVNGPFVSDESWDAALSAGRAVWAIANDDTHDLTDIRRTARAWTMIDAPSPRTADIVTALRAGRSYAVFRANEAASAIETVLDAVQFAGNTLTVTVSGDPSTFTFIGQDGQVRRIQTETTTASYAFLPGDTYIRTVVRAPRTTLLLNPVLRSDASGPPALHATVNGAATMALRASGLALGCAACIAIFRRRARRRHRLSIDAPSPVLAPADRESV